MSSKRVQKMDASGIRRAFELARALKNPIDLSIGQPDFDISEKIQESAIAAIRSGENRYAPTQGIEPLRKLIAKKLKREGMLHAALENIMVTSAVSGGLSVTLPAVIDHGDEVIIFDPSFVGYKQIILLYGGKPVFVTKHDDFSINFEALRRAITKRTKAIIFSSPENPTGYVYSEEELKKLAKIADEHNLVVFSDEIYADFTYIKKQSSIGVFYDRAVVLNGFSKSHGMMGWRVGYLSAPRDIIENALKIQQFTFVCPATPFQFAAIKALKTKNKKQIGIYKKRRDLVYKGLKSFYEIQKPSGGFYFYIKYPFDGPTFIHKCLAQNLIVVPGSSFSKNDTHFRICYAANEEKLKKALTILRSIVQEKD